MQNSNEDIPDPICSVVKLVVLIPTVPGTVIGTGAAHVLPFVVRVAPVMVEVAGFVFHVRRGEHWSLTMRFTNPAENCAESVTCQKGT